METKTVALASFWLATTLAALAVSHDAQAQYYYPNPQATTPVDGSYTVSYAPNCNDPPPEEVDCVFTYLQERVEPSGAWTNVSFGSGSIDFSSKPEGTYSYRVYLGAYQIYYGYGEFITSTISVVVADDPVRDDILTQLEYEYEVRQGYFNADSDLDIFVNKVSGGDPLNGTVENLILQQEAPVAGVPTFSWVVPTSTQANAASGWPISGIEPVLHDVNVDGFVDIGLRDVDSVAGGAPDHIVYSPGQLLQAQPKGIRPLDSSLIQFAENTLDYMVDSDFFADNAPTYYYQVWIWYASCPAFSFPDLESYYWSWFSGCYIDYIYLSGVFADYSVFSQEAISIWTNDYQAVNGYLTSSDAMEAIEEAVADILASVIGGWDPSEIAEIFGSVGDHADPDRKRMWDIFQAIVNLGRIASNVVTPEQAPVQAPRAPDVIWITGRRLLTIPYTTYRPGHLALEYTNPQGIGGWISGRPETFMVPWGKLQGDFRHGNDEPVGMMTVGSVPVAGASEVYWNNTLVPRLNNFDGLPHSLKPEYDTLPELGNGYNSNSFVSGIVPGDIEVVPWTTPIAYPGWSDPVPEFYFQ
jgi:hypothetical protein